MSRRRSRSHPVHGQARLAAVIGAGTAWSQLMRMGGDVAVASARTIAHRTLMLSKAAAGTAAIDHPEIALMGREKLDAAAEAGAAMMGRLPSLQALAADWAWREAMRGMCAMLDASACQSLAGLAAVQSRFVEDSVAASLRAGARLARDGARLAESGLRPVGRVASANARRLAARSRAS